LSARAIMDRLVGAGSLEWHEERRESFVAFPAAVATTLAVGADSLSVAAAGAGPDDWERLILDTVDRDGRITRSEAADLCGVEPREARTVLERLVKRGELEVRGERRGAHYARPDGVMTGRS